jgi:hypothetical protein
MAAGIISIIRINEYKIHMFLKINTGYLFYRVIQIYFYTRHLIKKEKDNFAHS